jgi:hypothetical protein
MTVRRWILWPFLAVVAVNAALVFAQAAFAGSFLSGNAEALRLHEASGTEVITLVTLVQFVLAVLVWRPGRGPAWPALLSALLIPAVIFQIEFGFTNRLALHVPLGVAIFGLSLVLLLGSARLTRRNLS